MTSESASISTVAGQAARASRPPLKRERCLRTVLSSPIVAPAASSSCVTACLSSSVTGGAGRGRERRAAAGDQHDDEIVGGGGFGERQQPGGGREPARVGDRMTGLRELDPLAGQTVGVLDHDEPVADAIAEDRLQRARHRRAGLAGAEHDHPASVAQLEAEIAGGEDVAVQSQAGTQQRGDVTGGERRAPDGAGRLAGANQQSCGASAGAPRPRAGRRRSSGSRTGSWSGPAPGARRTTSPARWPRRLP